AVLARLLADDPSRRAFVLVRDIGRWQRVARTLAGDRVHAIQGDLRADGLGLAPNDRATLSGSVRVVVHLAADTTFSTPLARARAINTAGTERMVELAAECESPVRLAFVSTAFVAGRRTGLIA